MEHPSIGTPPAGSIRFNTDSSKLELYNGDKWWNIDSTSPEAQTGGTRGMTAAGSNPGAADHIDFWNIATTGNAADFGDITTNTEYLAAGQGSSRTRAIFAGGRTPGPTYINTIEYATISSTGDAANFGDLSDARHYGGIASDGTRAVVAGGYDGSANVNVIDYITIASTGDAKDFGDTTKAISDHGAFASPTRAVFGGANIDDNMEYVTISTQGNGAKFGDLYVSTSQCGGGSNAIRGIITGGNTPTEINTMQYITIATLGNSLDFGDLTVIRRLMGTVTSPTRLCAAGGRSGPTNSDVIDYVQIMTIGNAVDFGDLTGGIFGNVGSNSNGHGGLG